MVYQLSVKRETRCEKMKVSVKFLNNFSLFTNTTLIYIEFPPMTCCESGTDDAGLEETDPNLLFRAAHSG